MYQEYATTVARVMTSPRRRAVVGERFDVTETPDYQLPIPNMAGWELEVGGWKLTRITSLLLCRGRTVRTHSPDLNDDRFLLGAVVVDRARFVEHGETSRLLCARCVLDPLDLVGCGEFHAWADSLLRRANCRCEHQRGECESQYASRSNHDASPGARTISRFWERFNPADAEASALRSARPNREPRTANPERRTQNPE